MYSYKTFGTCSTEILLDIDKDHVINDLVIVNGVATQRAYQNSSRE